MSKFYYSSCWRRRRSRGSIYVAILGLSLLVIAIGVGGLAITRIQSRSNDLRNDIQEARSYAQSAIELGRTYIALDRTWRTDYTNGVWANNKAIGNGSFSLSVQNPNGALNHADSDPVILTGTGVKGNAVQTVQVTLNMTLVAVSSLNTSISAGSINFQNATVTGSGSTVCSLGGVLAVTANIYPNVSAAGLIVGTTFYNNTSSSATAPTMPDTHVFEYYLANGTSIPISSVPKAGPNYQIDQSLLSPAANPFSTTTNANGIYIIDCQNNNLIIQNSRIVGTLVILNPGSASIIQHAMVWEPAVANYPCLLVQGSISLQCDSATLKETGGHNYNPAGTPYPYASGTSNSQSNDSFAAGFNSFIYVTGNLSVSQTPTVDGLIVGGTFTVQNTLALTFSPTFYNSPPPGFYSVQMNPAPGVMAASGALMVWAARANRGLWSIMRQFHPIRTKRDTMQYFGGGL